MTPRKVKESDIAEEKVEQDAHVEPLEYGEVVKDLKAERNVEVDCPDDFIIPPPGYKEPDDKDTDKTKVKKPRMKKEVVPSDAVEKVKKGKKE